MFTGYYKRIQSGLQLAVSKNGYTSFPTSFLDTFLNKSCTLLTDSDLLHLVPNTSSQSFLQYKYFQSYRLVSTLVPFLYSNNCNY